jgi:hypothetical protein
MSSDFALSVLAAAGVLLSALLVQGITLLRSRQDQSFKEQADAISAAFRQVEESERTKAARRAPQGLGRDELSTWLDDLGQRIDAGLIAVTSEKADEVADLIAAYHEQALTQARVQFWFSAVAAAIGFGWILYRGSQIDIDDLGTISRVLPGIVTDAIALLFFRQAADTRQRATEFYDRLRRDRQLSDSIALVSSIEDVRVKSAVQAQIALHLSGLEPQPLDLTKFLAGEEAPRPG